MNEEEESSSYPEMMKALVVFGWHGGGERVRGPPENRHPNAARLRGAAVNPHRVLEAPVGPGWCGALEHSGRHLAVKLRQTGIAHHHHELHTQESTQIRGQSPDEELLTFFFSYPVVHSRVLQSIPVPPAPFVSLILHFVGVLGSRWRRVV